MKIDNKITHVLFDIILEKEMNIINCLPSWNVLEEVSEKHGQIVEFVYDDGAEFRIFIEEIHDGDI